MPRQIVMDSTGDTRFEFNSADAAAVTEALARFKQLTDAGFTAAVRKGSGSSELVRDFRSYCRWRRCSSRGCEVVS